MKNVLDKMKITKVSIDDQNLREGERYVDFTIDGKTELFLVVVYNGKSFKTVRVLHNHDNPGECHLCGEKLVNNCKTFEPFKEDLYEILMNHPTVRLRNIFKK